MTAVLSAAVGQSSPSAGGTQRVKARYLCNFARFVEWPESSFSSPDAPFQICIYGNDELDGELELAIRGKTADARRLELEHPLDVQQAKSCHVLFISQSKKGQAAQILHELEGASILTVSDMDDFRGLGGMISFVTDGDQVRFDVDLGQAQRSGLNVSSRLLAIARMVISRVGGK